MGDHVRKKRLDLKLLQKDGALFIGVEEVTVYNWENNRTSPDLRCITKFIEFLDYVPFDGEPKILGEKIVHYRRLAGMTQKELARQLGVDPSTLARWERGERKLQQIFRHNLLDCFQVLIQESDSDRNVEENK